MHGDMLVSAEIDSDKYRDNFQDKYGDEAFSKFLESIGAELDTLNSKPLHTDAKPERVVFKIAAEVMYKWRDLNHWHEAFTPCTALVTKPLMEMSDGSIVFIDNSITLGEWCWGIQLYEGNNTYEAKNMSELAMLVNA